MPIATFFSPVMAMLTGNVGGAIQQLPPVNLVGGRERAIIAAIPLAGQASGSVIALARVPLNAVLIAISAISDTSLGSATISFGDTANATLYAAAATLTSVNARATFGNAATTGQPIVTGYDCLTGQQVTFQKAGTGGAVYEDIVLTVGAAALPGAGNLVVIVTYMID